MKTRTPPLLALAAFLVVGLAPAAWTQASTDPSLVFDKIEAMVEMRDGVPLPTDVYVPKVGHRFRKGHRIMVQVQSTWFPIIDRNPQIFVPNIFEAKDADYHAATHEIHRSRRFPSRIELPVVAR